MSRSGYSDDYEFMGLWQGTVERSIKGKRGQAFLTAMANALEAMPEKRLIAGQLVSENGECCAMGSVCVARSLDASSVDYEDRDQVAALFNIAPSLAAEIAYQNDDDFFGYQKRETPEARWMRMRKWVEGNLVARPAKVL